MERNQIILNEENREQKANHYCEYTFKRYGIDADGQEAQLIRFAHVHGYNAGFEAARDAIRKMMYYPQESESKPTQERGDELDAEVEKYIKEKKMYDIGFVVQSVAKYFANWQREQMMRGALDGMLVIGDEAQLCVPALQRITRTMDNGDKVKVLIVKNG